MFLEKIPPDTMVLKNGQSVFLKKKGAHAVLLLPGYNGYTADLTPLAKVVYKEGFSAKVHRYPGHGTNEKDFLASDHRDWLRSAVDAYLELRSQYDHVFVLGFSMGGLIAMILAAHFDLSDLVLIAPPIINRDLHV